MPEIGKKAPDFEAVAHNNQRIKLSDFIGKTVVLYFYPKDMTPGCTMEACSFRDQHPEFEKLDAVVLGVSGDSISRHQTFSEKYQLPFLLIADEDHAIAMAYGVWKEKMLFGKTSLGIERSTFLIDKEGILRKVWRKVKVKGHAEEVLDSIRNELISEMVQNKS